MTLEPHPQERAQPETELKAVLRTVFWGAMLAPVVLDSAYYLMLALVH